MSTRRAPTRPSSSTSSRSWASTTRSGRRPTSRPACRRAEHVDRSRPGPSLAPVGRPVPRSRTMTFSIIARDPATGELGIAVASHYFGLANQVPWFETGVGVIAAQRHAHPTHGPQALAMLEAGSTAEATLAAILAADHEPERRQLAILDRD